MAIEKISRQEFEALPLRERRPIAPEMAAVRALAIGEAIKYPCRWKHTTNGRRCQNGPHAQPRIKVTVRCIDGTVYVLRIA